MNLSRNPLAILTDEVSQELDEVIRFAQEFQLDGVELRSLFGKACKDLSREDIATIGRQTKDAGLRIAGVASPVFKCSLDEPADIKAHVELFKSAVESAVALDSDIVRVFTFLRKGEMSETADIHRAADQFGPLFEAVRGTGVRIGLENEATTIVGTGAETKAFLDYLKPDPKLLGVVWDPCNVLYLPSQTDPVADDFPLIADHLLHVHIKDARREADGKAVACVEIGTGDLDYPRHLRDLRERNYTGWITLETHWRQQNLSAEDQHLPAGYAFSANAAEPSRICLRHLQDWLAAV